MTDSLCARPGCGGRIVDGICEDCGRPPAGRSLIAGLAGTASRPAPRATAPTQATGGTAPGSHGSGRSGRSSARGSRGSSRRTALGGGLVALPPMPPQDPLTLVMADPVVPDSKRLCGSLVADGASAATGTGGRLCNTRLGRDHGFCPQCGAPYDFRAALKRGDKVGGQIRIEGPIAFGGLGWIYLGWDETLSRRVVLKGLLNRSDPAAAAAAVAERQFLAAVKHGRIVGIHTFATHDGAGYIVMEYVGGRTLKALRKDRGPLPPAEAVAYILGILPAFAYLHAQGMVYCDFKPDNIMIEGEDVKLIDLGGVRRADDAGGDVYTTTGYAAPEGARAPSVTGDLYTIGRSLAVLLMQFDHSRTWRHSLPPATEQPVLAAHPALERFLRRACHANPEARFQTAEEMADQLWGVLRDLVATDDDPKPAESGLFLGNPACDAGTTAEFPAAGPPWTPPPEPWRLLPTPKLDAADPAAQRLLALAAVTDPDLRRTQLKQIRGAVPASLEARLRYAEALTDHGADDRDEAAAVLDTLDIEEPWDWRVWWQRGRLALASGKPATAAEQFDKVWSELPGERAPRLALALAHEAAGATAGAADKVMALAADHARAVLRVDPGWTGAGFCLARCLAATGDLAGAADAYARVPATSLNWPRAQLSRARALIEATPRSAPTDRTVAADAARLVEAARVLEAAALDGLAFHSLAARVLERAVAAAEAKTLPATTPLLGHRPEAKALRLGAEKAWRRCARLAAADADAERIGFVDAANRIRPTTLF